MPTSSINTQGTGSLSVMPEFIPAKYDFSLVPSGNSLLNGAMQAINIAGSIQKIRENSATSRQRIEAENRKNAYETKLAEDNILNYAKDRAADDALKGIAIETAKAKQQTAQYNAQNAKLNATYGDEDWFTDKGNPAILFKGRPNRETGEISPLLYNGEIVTAPNIKWLEMMADEAGGPVYNSTTKWVTDAEDPSREIQMVQEKGTNRLVPAVDGSGNIFTREAGRTGGGRRSSRGGGARGDEYTTTRLGYYGGSLPVVSDVVDTETGEQYMQFVGYEQPKEAGIASDPATSLTPESINAMLAQNVRFGDNYQILPDGSAKPIVAFVSNTGNILEKEAFAPLKELDQAKRIEWLTAQALSGNIHYTDLDGLYRNGYINKDDYVVMPDGFTVGPGSEKGVERENPLEAKAREVGAEDNIPSFDRGADMEEQTIGDKGVNIEQPTQKYGFAKREPIEFFRDNFNTKLTQDEETEYRKWLKSESERRGRDISKDEETYDVRGFWKYDGKTSANGHGSDRWKKPNHITFSDESIYHGKKAPNGIVYKGGRWYEENGNPTYSPSQEMFDNNTHTIEELKDYERFENGGFILKLDSDKPVQEQRNTISDERLNAWIDKQMQKESEIPVFTPASKAIKGAARKGLSGIKIAGETIASTGKDIAMSLNPKEAERKALRDIELRNRELNESNSIQTKTQGRIPFSKITEEIVYAMLAHGEISRDQLDTLVNKGIIKL